MKKFYLTALTALSMTNFSVCSMETEENQRRTTKLHSAVALSFDFTGPVSFLLWWGADVNAQNKSDQTPLYIAAAKGYLNVARLLIEHGARLDLENGAGTPLHAAADNRNAAIVELLLKHGANVNAQNSSDQTPLHIAATKGYPDVARLLIEHGARLDLKANGKTPRAIAAENGNTAIIKLLLGMLLHAPAKTGDATAVEALLKDGAEVNIRHRNQTPLYIAADNGNAAIVELLIAHDADIDIPDTDHHITPLVCAILHGDLDSVRILVQAGADVNKIKDSIVNSTSLHFAAYGQNPELVTFLINHGADVNARNLLGETPLFKAIEYILRGENVEANLEVAQVLIQNGADVNCRMWGQSLLHVAIAAGNYRCTEFLIQHGADVDMYTSDVRRPLDLAINPPQTNQRRQDKSFCCFKFTTQARFRERDFSRTLYCFPVLNEYPKIIVLLLTFCASHRISDLENIKRRFPHDDIIGEFQRIRDQAIETALDLPRDLSRLIISFDHSANAPSTQ